MSTSLAAKRMAKERKNMETENSDYFVQFADDNLLNFDAYVVGPAETPYHHKLAHLKFEVPPRYPIVPPKVTFVQHGGFRLHPNLYVEGKVCLSILGTWAGEPWAFGMTCHTVLITIRSLLDDKPYTHEPNCSDNPAYNKFVEYASWQSMLIDHLKWAPNEACKAYICQHIRDRQEAIRASIVDQSFKNKNLKQFSSPYHDLAKVPGARVPDYMRLKQAIELNAREAGEFLDKIYKSPKVLNQNSGRIREEDAEDQSRKRCRVSETDSTLPSAQNAKLHSASASDGSDSKKSAPEVIDLT